MTTALQRRKGTATNHNSFTGLDAEITINTTNKSIHVHDGTTAGGYETARADFANIGDVTTNINFDGTNKITFNTDELEIYTTSGDASIEVDANLYTKVNGVTISTHSSSGFVVPTMNATNVTIPSQGKIDFHTYSRIETNQDDLFIDALTNDTVHYNRASSLSFWTGSTTTSRTEKLNIGRTITTHRAQQVELRKVLSGSPSSTSSQLLNIHNESSGTYGAYIRFTSQHQFYTPVSGYIGSNAASSSGNLYISGPYRGLSFGSNNCVPCTTTGQNADNTYALGSASARFDDAYVTNGVTTGSDRNLKQDIEQLSDAEQRVAVACKSLIRKYRWRDAFEEKGEDARIHIGIIAQDLEDAFNAEGLDPARYGMFCQDTYWWKEELISAQEEEYVDESGETQTRIIDEFVERTVYENESDAPDGSTEVTIKSVRYTELLAFIISAM